MRGFMAAAVMVLGMGGVGMADEAVVLTVEPGSPACKSFLGFGAEWDPGFWLRPGVTEADWQLVTKRIEWMKIPLVRMMMRVNWCSKEAGTYDWERPEMKNVCRYLDVCQKQGITVWLTDWGCEPGWLKVPGIADVGDAKYAEAIGTYMDYLLNKKGYSCIKYFIMVNEPNFEVGNFGRWKKGVENVTGEFKRRGLDKKVIFAGSDESGDDSWHRMAVDQMQNMLGAYDIHRYAPVDEVRSGGLKEFYKAQWEYALSKDAKAGGKPKIVGEAGIMAGGSGTSNNALHLDYEYGVYMADYAVQAAGAGSWGVSAWMLEDSSHENFTWGMWKDKRGGFALKPWFYVWSLLSRYVPAGSSMYEMESGPDVRALAAHSSGKGKEGWTFCVVNRGDQARRVVIRVTGGKKVTLKDYVYSREGASADKDGFPIPVGEIKGDLGAGVEVMCPAESVRILTSIKREDR